MMGVVSIEAIWYFWSSYVGVSANGRGDTILYEHKVWSARARSAGCIDRIPESWRFSVKRIEELTQTLSPSLVRDSCPPAPSASPPV